MKKWQHNVMYLLLIIVWVFSIALWIVVGEYFSYEWRYRTPVEITIQDIVKLECSGEKPSFGGKMKFKLTNN